MGGTPPGKRAVSFPLVPGMLFRDFVEGECLDADHADNALGFTRSSRSLLPDEDQPRALVGVLLVVTEVPMRNRLPALDVVRRGAKEVTPDGGYGRMQVVGPDQCPVARDTRAPGCMP